MPRPAKRAYQSDESPRIPPNWPPLIPALPSDQINLQSIYSPSQILTTPLFTSKLASTYRNFLSSLSLTTTPSSQSKYLAARVNDRYQLNDPYFARALWEQTGLKEVVLSGIIDGEEPLSKQKQAKLWGGNTVLGLSDNIRIYRYSTGQYFDKHFDDSNDVEFLDIEAKTKIKGRTTWTLLIYLSSKQTGCEGGETVFYPVGNTEGIVVDLQVGLALLHRHGEECLQHEGRKVDAGEKWVIRSDLVVAR